MKDRDPLSVSHIGFSDADFRASLLSEDRSPQETDDRPSPFGKLIWRPTLRRRGQVEYLTCRSWSFDSKADDLAALKIAKRIKEVGFTQAAAGEIVQVVGAIFGPLRGWTITSVACGHSRDHECWGKCLAREVAKQLQLGFVEIFEDRFVSGSSHPKEFAPLIFQASPASPILLIDDLSTSGWHLEEAATQIRAQGVSCFPVAWIGGIVS